MAGLPEIEASKYVSLYWGGMLIGRFMGAVELSDMKKVNKQISLVVIPLLAYLLLWVAQSAPLDAIRGGSSTAVFELWKDRFVQNWAMFQTYLPFLALCWVLFQFGKSLAGRTLMIFSAMVVVLLVTAIVAGGKTGHVVRRRRGFVHVHWLVEHLLAGDRRHRHLQEPGLLAAGDGHPRRGGPAAAAGPASPM